MSFAVKSQPLVILEYSNNNKYHDKIAWLSKIDNLKKRRIARKRKLARTLKRSRPGGY